MEIGVENLVFAKLHPFRGLRLLDLNDHVRPGENLFGRPGDAGAGCTVGIVVGTDAGTGAGFHEHIVPVCHIFAHGAGCQADAIFMILDFLRAADAHRVSSERFCEFFWLNE